MRYSSRKFTPDGEIFPDGTYATHCPRIQPDMLRYLRFDKIQRRAVGFHFAFVAANALLIGACGVLTAVDFDNLGCCLSFVALVPATAIVFSSALVVWVVSSLSDESTQWGSHAWNRCLA